MTCNIHFRIILNTNKEKNALVVFNKLQAVFLNRLEIEDKQVYWKDKSLFEINCKLSASEGHRTKIIDFLFQKISIISSSWNISFEDYTSDEDKMELSGFACDSFHLSGIHWISFSVIAEL